ncbi:MAG: hypothetical protein A3A24_02535 [Candidatus Buchananbacteria bacterium RIFCSPLOWO2_01_FULL_46_12]|uniref:Type 4 fimbrial biogenesis protein PilX N-terminal domain-containing protein n=1 Tax=Candidatus Buchananbacteria bacterium RIFCSPLOWO2_01_FULL_46_12 TaxID=1797546 RepID=A0A1G1YN32_9BACT|nr:MAG: hypothetical protein A3A24_02535 [Candidatus Buchananbacteria bacterium RIFCSPLOWO2_01_FULL_46_12]
MASTNKKQNGMVLVLAILIIAAVLATATVFSELIIRQIQQSRLIDQSIQAYYLAESGAERTLHQIRILESVVDCATISIGSCQENNARCSLDAEIPCVTSSQGSLDTAVTDDWQVVVSEESQTDFVLTKGETFQIDLFSPQQVQDANITKIDVGSSVNNLKLFGELVNLTNILQVGVLNCADQPPVFKDIITAPQSRSALDGKNILAACSYVFRLRFPLDSPVDQAGLTLKLYDDAESQVNIPSRLIIDSTARFGSSIQTVVVRTPIRPPLSGLYDFVLFSEEEIVK